mmetsp:Transcript_20682/g.39305  ORF Transcript_20682/g.39305 Transcript_20682/m.39305 type:complete len:311 (+) Transcript_20682:229-1161(+)
MADVCSQNATLPVFKNAQSIKLYVPVRRWLEMYDEGLLRRALLLKSTQQLSPIQKILPEEMLLEVFFRMPPQDVARAAGCCRQWRGIARSESIWRACCLVAWKRDGRKFNKEMVLEKYCGCWYDMWMYRPRLRFDGIYVSRNTYVKPGSAGWHNSKPVHLVVYYRYLYFHPEGTMAYKTSPHPLKQVAKEILRCKRTRPNDGIYCGQWALSESTLTTTLTYPGNRPTQLSTENTLRGNCLGANNRIDVHRLNSVYEDTEDRQRVATNTATVERDHLRRTQVTSYVFVSIYDVDTHPLNMPVDVMDFYIAD